MNLVWINRGTESGPRLGACPGQWCRSPRAWYREVGHGERMRLSPSEKLRLANVPLTALEFDYINISIPGTWRHCRTRPHVTASGTIHVPPSPVWGWEWVTMLLPCFLFGSFLCLVDKGGDSFLGSSHFENSSNFNPPFCVLWLW